MWFASALLPSHSQISTYQSIGATTTYIVLFIGFWPAEIALPQAHTALRARREHILILGGGEWNFHPKHLFCGNSSKLPTLPALRAGGGPTFFVLPDPPSLERVREGMQEVLVHDAVQIPYTGKCLYGHFNASFVFFRVDILNDGSSSWGAMGFGVVVPTQPARRIEAHRDQVSSVAFSLNGIAIVSGGADGIVKVR